MRHGYVADSGESLVLDDLELSIAAGEIVALTGPSGSGKSTLLRLLGCLDRAHAGTIAVGGVDTTTASARRRRRLRRDRIGYVRQNPADNLIDHLTVRQHFMLATGMGGRTSTGPAELAERLGVAGKWHRRPRELSGGEQQRVAIGFAALGRSDLLLLDEPTGQLDHAIGEQVLDTLDLLRDTGLTIVVATHDPKTARRADRTCRLIDGKVAA
ncbi:ABC transporter ATP-binding protein [Stackebrandtia albiflava]|uniref:ABC transporter ATP-binding protein n=1 Tax=Stackebrandtia albiflava TaxID=406432 RepID=UPI0011BF090D|nr:ATP-binding cassette domain-containing protein [Stackebrandtia albiflava]